MGQKDEILYRITRLNSTVKEYKNLIKSITGIVKNIYGQNDSEYLPIINLNRDNFLRGKRCILKVDVYSLGESKKDITCEAIKALLIKEEIVFLQNK